jgi:histidyl-tRNA synthetase
VVRAYLQHSLASEQPVRKLYYITSIFRYERPQAGRYRERHQVGVEAIGSADPAIDAEVISLGMDYLASLGIEGLELKINSVGCPDCRPRYREALKESVKPYLAELCESCRVRYDANPLRMLDCKVPGCRELTAGVPSLTEYLCDECSAHLASVLKYLDAAEIKYTLDPRLVRGFDYYTKTAFEVQSNRLGAQSAVLGGGRYDLLVEEMGGPKTAAVGFGSGIERTLAIMEAEGVQIPSACHPDVFVVTLGEAPRAAGVQLVLELRRMGVAAEMDYAGKSMKAQMRSADRSQAEIAVIIGDDELAGREVKARNMQTREEAAYPLATAASRLKGLLCKE